MAPYFPFVFWPLKFTRWAGNPKDDCVAEKNKRLFMPVYEQMTSEFFWLQLKFFFPNKAKLLCDPVQSSVSFTIFTRIPLV